MKTYKRLFVIIVASVTLTSALHAQQSGGCHTPSSESTGGLGWLTSLVTSTAASTITFKSNIHITATSASDVSLVTDNVVCTAVASARASEMQVAYDSTAIYVYKVGNVYVADEHVGSSNAGTIGYRAMHIFDLAYNFLAIAGR